MSKILCVGRIKYAPLILAVLLAGCVAPRSHFAVPEKVSFRQQTYVKVTSNQIDEMQHLLYLPENSSKNPEQWDKGILFFLDKNTAEQTLVQRMAFRQSSFAKQPDMLTKLSIEHNELQSSVIYPPTERYQNVMLEVTRGRNLDCGYAQIQFADKRTLPKAQIAKKSPKLTAYTKEIADVALAFKQMAWQIQCKA